MNFKVNAIFTLSVLLSACAGGIPTKPEEQATFYLEQGSSAYSKGLYDLSVNNISSALEKPTGAEKVREAFKNQPGMKKTYFENLNERISNIRDAWDVNKANTEIQKAQRAFVFSEAETSTLKSKFDTTLVEGNRTGTIKLTLADKIDTLTVLQTPEHLQLIVDRTLLALTSNSNPDQRGSLVTELMNYVQKVGKNSSEGQKIATLLPSMNIRRSELGTVEKVFPDFVAARKEHLTTKVSLQVKNADRLFSDDVISNIKSSIRGIEVVPKSGPTITTVTIDKARHDEKVTPERTETITYSNSDVNILQAALFMPRGASYLFDQLSGGAEIEYGYVVTATQDGKTIFDEVVRGKLGGEYSRCQNARIQNVFGGVSRADFVANDDMQRRCSGASNISMEELRKQVFSKITDGVLRIEPIKAVHELN
jgi:hypothetical protein